nr:tyrosine-type recombinase/integrase [Nostoc sp. CHAB 5715]
MFGVCLYAGARINEACTLLKRDVITPRGVRPKLIIRSYNTKGGRDTREIQIHPILKDYLEAYAPLIKTRGKNPHLFPGRHGLNHIHQASADRLMREALQRVGLEERGMSTHSFRRTCLTAMSDIMSDKLLVICQKRVERSETKQSQRLERLLHSVRN